MASELNRSFTGEKAFCWNCGSILPMLDDSGTVKCFMCKFVYGPEAFGAMENQYEIKFRSPEELYVDPRAREKESSSEKARGPVVERRCPKCGNNIMSYATVQLRSADEGQTIFYTCVKCGHKESENS